MQIKIFMLQLMLHTSPSERYRDFDTLIQEKWYQVLNNMTFFFDNYYFYFIYFFTTTFFLTINIVFSNISFFVVAVV